MGRAGVAAGYARRRHSAAPTPAPGGRLQREPSHLRRGRRRLPVRPDRRRLGTGRPRAREHAAAPGAGCLPPAGRQRHLLRRAHPLGESRLGGCPPDAALGIHRVRHERGPGGGLADGHHPRHAGRDHGGAVFRAGRIHGPGPLARGQGHSRRRSGARRAAVARDRGRRESRAELPDHPAARAAPGTLGQPGRGALGRRAARVGAGGGYGARPAGRVPALRRSRPRRRGAAHSASRWCHPSSATCKSRAKPVPAPRS